MKLLISISLFAFVLTLLSSCAHIHTQEEGFSESPSQSHNGSNINIAFKPYGESGGFALSAMVYMAGSSKLTGPFLCRIQVHGKPNFHQSMIVHKIELSTSKTQRKDTFPLSYLNKEVAFQAFKGTPLISYAYFQLPGLLKLTPEKDGVISMNVDITIKSIKNQTRKKLQFQLTPNPSKKWEFVFIPSEILNSSPNDPRIWKPLRTDFF